MLGELIAPGPLGPSDSLGETVEDHTELELSGLPTVDETGVALLQLMHAVSVETGAGQPAETGDTQAPSTLEIELKTNTEDIWSIYDVKRIKVEIENIQPQTENADPFALPEETDQAPANVETQPFMQAAPQDAKRPPQVEKLVVTDPLVSVRQNQRESIHVVQAGEKGAFRDKPQRDLQQAELAPQTPAIATDTGSPPKFQSEIGNTEIVRSTPAFDPPPPPPVARRVSMEIGEAGSEVMVTIRERNGDLSLHFDAATESLRRDLETSSDSLVEVFEREQLRLTDLGFSNSFGSATDAERHADEHGRSRRNLKQTALFADKDETYQFHHALSGHNSNRIAS
jgi:hypothetical protein